MTSIPTQNIRPLVVAYSQATYDAVAAPFSPIDHRTNQRSDWQEYWPIRKYLLWENLSPDHYYGFLSPRFTEKTGITGQYLMDYMSRLDDGLDVVLFSPQPDMAALFLNVFEQNEVFDPGFKDTAQAFFDKIGLSIDVSAVVMDSSQIVFSNYFLAKPAFWRRWLSVCEQLFDLCEHHVDQASDMGLLKATTYRDGVQRKVFLMERIASVLLTVEKHWNVHAYNPFLCAYSASRLKEFANDAVVSDALKMAYNRQQYPDYLHEFSRIRNRIRDSAPVPGQEQ